MSNSVFADAAIKVGYLFLAAMALIFVVLFLLTTLHS
jgi:hypothetical protein